MKPLYYRWAFCPSNADVLLSHNQESHPADIRTHQDLSEEAGERDMVHGYAYRIGNGFRILDYEHKPLEDPFIRGKVMAAVGQEEAGEEATPLRAPERKPIADPDLTDRYHYGMPV